MHSDKDIEFLQLHWDDDPVRLLLSAAKHGGVDMVWVAQQIEGRKQARVKWPRLAEDERIWYPPRLNREQASSERLAAYKRELVASLDGEHRRMADLTGGFGMDAYCFSQIADTMDYVEMDAALCEVAEHNLAVLGANNVECCRADSMEWLQGRGMYDVIFIDPARRDEKGRKVAAFEDCTPNLLDNLEMIMQHCRRLVVKASPMISIPAALEQLGLVERVDVVALKGECKEVILVLESDATGADCVVNAVNLEADGRSEFSFTLSQEAAAEAEVRYLQGMPTRYLYEPNAAVMKSGGYCKIAVEYGLQKLARNTHMYASDSMIDGFVGRVFEVIEEVRPKEVAKKVAGKRAHVVTRNYPMAAAELQKKLKLQEGGELFVIGTTVGSTPKVLLCRRVNG